MKRVGATEELRGYIREFDLESFLNPQLLDGLRVFRFPAYTTIYREQSTQRHFFLLVEGQLQCSHYHANGKLAVIALIEPLTAIGDLEVLIDDPLRSDVVATRPSVLLGLPRETVRRHGADDPRFLRFLISEMRKKLYQSNAVQTGLVLPVVSRLSTYLLAQADSDTDDPERGHRILLPDKERLAALMGTTVRHLNRVLSTLEESNAISLQFPTVRIVAKTVLEEFVEG